MLGSVACNAVLGLEERTLEEPDVCEEYCTTIMGVCVDDALQYQTAEICLAACYRLNTGEPGDRSGNSVECRRSFLADAEAASGDERVEACRKAGFASLDGASASTCGDACELYCTLMPEICRNAGIPVDPEACGNLCSGFDRVDDFVATNDDMKNQRDTLQCRVWHLANAAALPNDHCGHAAGVGLCNE
jgi:hypothetical protein